MITVKQLLISKGHDIYAVSPQSSVYDALKVMADKGVGALLVMEDQTLAGIISERDYARKVILHGKSSLNTLVKDIMTAKVVTAGMTHTVQDCLTLMTDKRIRHLPVTGDNGEVLGILSIGDLVKSIIAQQAFMIEQLESYIRS